ncbi:MAG: outer membrane lipoprotein carrier protein LolA [Ignavibacteriae bacterium]|nr:MAG: outer membrane lipoprotein carrier protein LolA [Ignavibacteriota bacterium]
MKIKLMMVGAFICMVFLETAAQEKELTVKMVTEQLHHRYEMIDDAVVQFEQHVKFGFSNIEQNFSGILKMKKPKHYRIESEHQTIVTDGMTVWAYSSANNQVIVDKYKENSNSISPEQFMLNLPANYYASLLGTEKQAAGNMVLLKLIPKDDRSFVKSVKISVEESGWLLRKIEIMDVNETETTYTVKDIKLNTNIKDKIFTFEAPEGAEVVDLR